MVIDDGTTITKIKSPPICVIARESQQNEAILLFKARIRILGLLQRILDFIVISSRKDF